MCSVAFYIFWMEEFLSYNFIQTSQQNNLPVQEPKLRKHVSDLELNPPVRNQGHFSTGEGNFFCQPTPQEKKSPEYSLLQLKFVQCCLLWNNHYKDAFFFFFSIQVAKNKRETSAVEAKAVEAPASREGLQHIPWTAEPGTAPGKAPRLFYWGKMCLKGKKNSKCFDRPVEMQGFSAAGGL